MPITHQWLIPGRVVYVNWSGYLTIDDLAGISTRTIEFLNNGDAPVHLIRDDSKLEGNPPVSLRELIGKVQSTRHPAMGWAVTIGKSAPHITVMTDLYCKVMRVRHHRAGSVQEALSFLQQVDPTLDITRADASILSEKTN